MNEKITDYLRLNDDPICLYAAARIEELEKALHQYKARAEKAEKERDCLLMEKLKAEGECEECKYLHLLDECKSGVGCEFCDIPCYCHDCHGASKWEWRGVQED